MTKFYHKDPHAIFTIKIGRRLKETYPADEIRSYFQKNRPKLTLINGEEYLPDIWNKSKKLVYEVHYRSERKDEEFNSLPEGWRGINIFYDEEMCPETFVIKQNSFQIARIKWGDNNISIYSEKDYYKKNLAKNIRNLKILSDPHTNFIFRMHLLLQKLYSLREVYSDIGLNTTHHRIILKSGANYQPDLRNERKKLIYEVHYRGSRKHEEFTELPNGWEGVNVFYDEESNPETILIKEKSYTIQNILW